MMSAVLVFLFLAFSNISFAIDIDIGDLGVGLGLTPPPVEFRGQPELFPIPGRYAYFVTDIDVDMFFYQGRWFRPYKGRWFRSGSYNGPWESTRDVPPALRDLPPDFRNVPPGYYRIQYGELRDNWERWERDKYWDKRRAEDKERSVPGIAQPPSVRIPGSPEVLPIPGRYVYFIPDTDANIFFYRGSWYRFYNGRWFRSSRENGPWDYIRRVPQALRDVPLDYRNVPTSYSRIRYGELTDNWERWEQDRYWERKRDEERDRYREDDDRYQ